LVFHWFIKPLCNAGEISFSGKLLINQLVMFSNLENSILVANNFFQSEWL
jgi:hypothetical protein